MTDHKIVSHGEWHSSERRDLPWERVETRYVFEGPTGEETLVDLFAGRSQLIVYHFMFAPDLEDGCRGCSFWADNFNGIISHLNQRDVSLAAISRAPLQKLRALHRHCRLARLRRNIGRRPGGRPAQASQGVQLTAPIANHENGDSIGSSASRRSVRIREYSPLSM